MISEQSIDNAKIMHFEHKTVMITLIQNNLRIYQDNEKWCSNEMILRWSIDNACKNAIWTWDSADNDNDLEIHDDNKNKCDN